jgi:EAL domain-containing protein (putative c-di-GMP-specific phosphodiesterase class I)/CheY-like chemotaxis protein
MNMANLTVLVIEDDDFQRKIIIDILHSLGVQSTLDVGNGRQALDILRDTNSGPVDVALCDLNMPEMDGMEFLRHLGEQHRGIAVILVSALDAKVLSSVGRMTEMYGIQLLGIIEKPVLPASLKTHLQKLKTPADPMQQPSASAFSLDEILQGIRADQFVPYFQPKVDMKTGRIVGAEALARWQHPTQGIIVPNAFIPLLEKTANIDNLTYCILRKSAAALRAFHEKGNLITVAVNLSLVSLDDTALADKITQTVRETGIEPQYFVLEITESAAMTNVAPALENLARLCMNGFALSIDDYGTGSSNLQQLTRIAFSELKIDQSFVKGSAENKALRIVVESSIDMAHKLAVKSVAEGIETQEDWNTLAAFGCDTAQGYFVARPMDATAFTDFLASYKSKRTASMPQAAQDANKHPYNIKVLVVEDDAFTRKIIVQVLRDLGYASIADADSAISAIALLEAKSFDLIITDVNMPNMNGLELVRGIRTGKTAAKRETRIVILTSHSQSEVLASALALDINGFLVKPIIPAVVEAKLLQAMSERMRINSPLAYEAIRTVSENLPASDTRKPSKPRGASIFVGDSKVRSSSSESSIEHRVSLRKLRPGMVLMESIRLNDGTMILSSGHALTELSINRLMDLSNLLLEQEVAIQTAG